ncbi:MAG: amino acid ABC transporter permease [Lachnospiraceae bacterium]|jgi:amino ABC transporter, permease protein, 3-TM region, his/glu/gln/arg/opine family
MIEGEHMQEWFDSVGKKFVLAFVEGDRWKLYFKGLGVTLEIALFAAILGMVIGTVVALMRLSQKRNGKKTIWARIAGIYVDVIRGTPSVLQLLIMWFIVMKNSQNGVLVASLSFGINSGAYVSEIVRAGILAVDKGQTEAGRSLGLSKAQTMIYIVIPQAIKNVLPPIGNEFIVLLKETAIVGYVSLTDLTRAANQITSRTYEAFMPLIGAAVIYFTVIKILTILLDKLERRLRKSDNR